MTDEVAVAVMDVDGSILPNALSVEVARALMGSGTCDFLDLFTLLAQYETNSIPYAELVPEAYRAYARGLTGLHVETIQAAAERVWCAQKGNCTSS